MNLGWKLAATIRGTAPAGLLDTYEAERHPIGAKVLDWSRAQVVLMRPDPASRALRAVVEDLMDTADGATYMAGRVWGVETRYDLGGEHPLVGRSAPDFAFADGSRLGQHMQDGRAVLLDFRGDAATQSQAAAYGLPFRHVKAQAREDFGLGALLIRPDGIVCAAWPARAYSFAPQ
jgi:hypothetical protein